MKERPPETPHWLQRRLDDGLDSVFDRGYGVFAHIDVFKHSSWSEEFIPPVRHSLDFGREATVRCLECGMEFEITIRRGDLL